MAGFEEILAKELKKLGAKKIEVLNRAVKAEATEKTVYRINLCSYLALRVLIPLHEDVIHNEDHLYFAVKRINWNDYIHADQTLAVRSSVKSDYFTNSHYVELKTKDAICDQFTNRTGSRPDVDLREPDLSVNIHIFKNKLTISLDTSGDSLHKRGYRISSTVAPLNEVLAAGLIQLSGWDYKRKFIDPMCGSGTFLTEALLQYFNMPPQHINRDFAFKKWKNFRDDIWQDVVEEAMSKQRSDPDFKVYGSDNHPGAIKSAEYNLAEAGLLQYAELEVKDFHDYPITEGAHIMMNPPYDVRIQDDEIIESYKAIGDTLKQKCKDSQAWILSGNLKALSRVGLRPSKKLRLYNGPIESKFHKFEMYAGSKKAKYQQNNN